MTEQEDIKTLQTEGKGPAPCARFCEATAFEIEIAGWKPDQPYEVPSHHYQGTELHPYDGRPNAMDAFDKPSLFMGRLHYRDGRVEAAQ